MMTMLNPSYYAHSHVLGHCNCSSLVLETLPDWEKGGEHITLSKLLHLWYNPAPLKPTAIIHFLSLGHGSTALLRRQASLDRSILLLQLKSHAGVRLDGQVKLYWSIGFSRAGNGDLTVAIWPLKAPKQASALLWQAACVHVEQSSILGLTAWVPAWLEANPGQRIRMPMLTSSCREMVN